MNLSELAGGARINYIFHETFGRTLEKVNPLEHVSQVRDWHKFFSNFSIFQKILTLGKIVNLRNKLK